MKKSDENEPESLGEPVAMLKLVICSHKLQVVDIYTDTVFRLKINEIWSLRT